MNKQRAPYRSKITETERQKQAEADSEAKFADVMVDLLGLDAETPVAKEEKYRHPYWVRFAGSKFCAALFVNDSPWSPATSSPASA